MSSSLNFSATPAISITTTSSFPGTHCGFAFYANINGGNGPIWNSMTAVGLAEVAPSESTLSIPAGSLAPGQSVQFQANSDQHLALYCH